jgi:hypothetical protein
MDLLADGVAKFAKWWSRANSMLSNLEERVFLNDQPINSIRLETARKSWESVRNRYEVYSRTVSALQLHPV